MPASEYMLSCISLLSFSSKCRITDELWNIKSALYLYSTPAPSDSNTDYRHFAKLWTLCAIKLTGLKFEKQLPKSFYCSELGISIENCQHYCLVDGDVKGDFYFTVNQSIGQLSNTHILIERYDSVSLQYNFKSLSNSAIVAKIAISPFVASKSLKIRFEIIHQDPYTWKVLEAEKGFSAFMSKTWSKFYGKLYNSSEIATFRWDFSSREVEPFSYALEALPVNGTIELSNPENHLLMFAGMFLMEMELQLKAFD